MTTDDLLRAVVTGLKSSFLTARAAARRMTRQGSGVILHLFIGAHERADAAAAAALVREDIRITMPRTRGASTGWPRSGPCRRRASPRRASGAW